MRRPKYRNLEERLLFNSVHDPETGCRIWLGRLNNKGYGTLTIRNGKPYPIPIYAHRLAWELRNEREIPGGYTVEHECVNPACIEPDHMILLTDADNTRRQWERRRMEETGNA